MTIAWTSSAILSALSSSRSRDARRAGSACSSAAATPDLEMALHVAVVHVLLSVHRLARRLTENRPQVRGRLLPLTASQALGSHDELTFRGHSDDQFGHVCWLLSKPDADCDRAINRRRSLHRTLVAAARLLRELGGLAAPISRAQHLEELLGASITRHEWNVSAVHQDKTQIAEASGQ